MDTGKVGESASVAVNHIYSPHLSVTRFNKKCQTVTHIRNMTNVYKVVSSPHSALPPSPPPPFLASQRLQSHVLVSVYYRTLTFPPNKTAYMLTNLAA